eukprot:1024038-Heterocapsa_arctica.AAC.1
MEALDLTEILEINESVYSLLAQINDQEPLDLTKNTARGAGLEVWWKLQKRYDPQTVGRKRAI